MDKRYQVFLSSTFQDLHDERQEVIQALLELDCIPSGMELFPAANEDQWSLIKKVIDDCDYYTVIVGGRYGSQGPDGLSYTEMEYRYAVQREKPVIGFIHKNPGLLVANRCESLPEGQAKLEAFRGLVKQKMCRFWDSAADLGSQVSRSLVKLIKTHPAIGWVRADLIPPGGTAEEVLRHKQRIEALEAQLEAAKSSAPDGTSDLAQGDDFFPLGFSFTASPYQDSYDRTDGSADAEFTWNDVFGALGPVLIGEVAEHSLAIALNHFVEKASSAGVITLPKEFHNMELTRIAVSTSGFHTVLIQFRALGLITMSKKQRSVKDQSTYWTLTPYGDSVLTRLRAIRKGDYTSIPPPEQK